MGRIGMTGSVGSSVDLDMITAVAGDIVKGKVSVDKNGEPITGTLALSGNATEAYVYNGKTFYSTDPKARKTGKMTVNSLLSFKAAVTSGRKVTASWGNPKQASGKPYSGVYIRYSTSGYPGKTGGTQIYKGAGSNTASGGTSTASLTLPNLNTKYYLSIYPYVTCSAGELTGDVLNTSVTTGKEQTVTCTSSKTVTVPEGYTKADIFCVGGGGGGGGRTATKKGIAVTGGQKLAAVIGAGGISSWLKPGAGGTSSVSRDKSTLVSAAGGDGGGSMSANTNSFGGNGGSGGGFGGRDYTDTMTGQNAGSDGSGSIVGASTNASTSEGQGSTTRAWGTSSGTLYSGGGAGGGGVTGTGGNEGQGGAGGKGGGGAGGKGAANGGSSGWGSNGSANTGGGGGGSGAFCKISDPGNPGNGGSGIVLFRFY